MMRAQSDRRRLAGPYRCRSKYSLAAMASLLALAGCTSSTRASGTSSTPAVSTTGGSAATTGGPASPVQSSAATTGGPASPIQATTVSKPVTITFLHTYTGSDEDTIKALVNQFQSQNTNITVQEQSVGGYAALTQKNVAALQAGHPPNVSIAYEADIQTYLPSNRVLNLSPYATDPTAGLDAASKAAILPIEISRNSYAAKGGQLYGFPFTVADVVLYYNKTMLASAGIATPPATWDQFKADCAQIMTKLKKPCYPASIDASTVNAIGFSYGVSPLKVDGSGVNYGDAGWTPVFQLLSDLAKQKYAYSTAGLADASTADQSDFVAQQAAFIMRTSRSIPFVSGAIGSKFAWAAAPLPQGTATDNPRTVVFGPNLVAFTNSDPDKELASWLFVKFLGSASAQSYWAEHTGNLPIRTDVGGDPGFKDYLSKNPAQQVGSDSLPDAQYEGGIIANGALTLIMPSQVRTDLQNIEAALLTNSIDVKTAQQQIVSEADPLVAKARQGT